MKKINIIFAVIALLLIVSCDRKLDFQHNTFFTFDRVSLSVSESSGTISVPVSLFNPTGNKCQVAVEGVDGEGESGAVDGVNYKIVSPASGVLTFEGDNTTQEVEIALTPVAGLTGSKNFEIRLSSLTRGVSVGGYDVTTVKILDDDHPLADFIGKWTGTLLEMTTNMSYETEINIEAVESNYSRLTFDTGLDPVYGKGSKAKLFATVDDLKNPTMLEMASEQLTGYENFFISGLKVDENSFSFSDNIIFSLNNDGSLSIDSYYGIIVPNEAAGGYGLAGAYMAATSFVKKK